jgi:D-arabinose 1-dehydrogenase-like Zn-dependent alcohol dehydrogenase
MAKMRAVQVPKAGGNFEMVEREIPSPGIGEVRIKVQACGICHSDSVTKDGLFPNIQYPRVPGHEVIGTVDAIGAGVQGWTEGTRVGVGWHGGNCGYCDSCRRGDAFACEKMTLVTGITSDGGYSEYMISRAEAMARVPEGMAAAEIAPLMCAGVTTFNALRNSGARPGELVAVIGVGGLGHLGVQYAAKLGFRTVGIARGTDKEALTRQLGAHEYIDSSAVDPSEALQKLGGAKVVLATATESSAMESVLGGLAPNGSLMVIGATGPMKINPLMLLLGRKSVKGWYSGTSIDSQETLQFSKLEGVKSMNEIFPFERTPEAYDRMMSGKARFRAVVTMGS